jgi:flagellar biosynthetic protein FliO
MNWRNFKKASAFIMASPWWLYSTALAAPPLPGTETPDFFSAGLKMTGALILTIGGLLLLLYFLRRLGLSKSGIAGGQGLIRILATKPLTPKTYITLVEIGDTVLTLGVTGENISCLDKSPSESFHRQIDQEPAPKTETGFARRLSALIGAKSNMPAGDRE